MKQTYKKEQPKKVEIETPKEVKVETPVEVKVETPQEVEVESKKAEVGMTFDGTEVIKILDKNDIATYCEMSNGTTSWIEDFRVK